MSPVSINGVDKQGVYVSGVQVKQALDAANEDVDKGVYDATTLSAVDAELATANIKNGITIFGFAGSADVFNISDATAVEAEVLNPETFYAVGGGRRTGSMPTVSLAAGANAYPAGYHAGAASLTAVDGDLVTGSIKFGETIFGVAGHTNVRNVSDANALVGEVKTGRTFYAVGGARKTGTLATVAIVADNNAYPAGYHAGDGGGLSAIDVNLAAANIRSGVNIFGSVGVATVQEIGAANAVLADVKNGITFFSVTGGIKTGNMPTVAIAPGSSAYPTGYHAGDVGGLPAIDADLVTANIKQGITIFNVAGHVDVRNVSDANALVGEVKTGRTFYAVGGARKTGTMPTVAITAANDNYPAGYHAGNAGGLDAIDTDLATANIKSGITIFGKPGSTNVRDSTDANLTAAEAPTGKTFYAGGGARKTGSGTKTLSDLNDTVAAGYYAATTLSAVDVHLAAGNIKDTVNIFGKVGTFAGGPLVEDVKGQGYTPNTDAIGYFGEVIPSNGDFTLATKTQTYAAGSLAVFLAMCVPFTFFDNDIKVRVNIAGVQEYESAYVPPDTCALRVFKVMVKAVSGSQTINMVAHNYDGATARSIWLYNGGSQTGTPTSGIVFGASFKI